MNAKVVFFCSSEAFGGLEMNFVRLAAWLYERRNNITLIVRKHSPIAEYAQKAGFKDVDFVQSNKSNTFFFRTIRKKIDILAPGIVFVGANTDLKRIAFIKLLYRVSWKLVYQQQMQLGVSRKDPWHTLLYSQIDAWITPLHWLAREITSKTKFNSDRLHTIPLCIDSKVLDCPDQKAEESRQSLTISKKNFYLEY